MKRTRGSGKLKHDLRPGEEIVLHGPGRIKAVRFRGGVRAYVVAPRETQIDIERHGKRVDRPRKPA